jgi:tetratricopeptide (TPR) repeat protein
MHEKNKAWQKKVDDLWAKIGEYDREEFIVKMNELNAELPDGDPLGPFELGSAYDSVGCSEEAVPLYRQALELGLSDPLRRRATIQMASTLRNLGEVKESVSLLRTEMEAESDELDDAVRAFLALSLVDSGQEREAVSIALRALAPHLARYQVSMGRYAKLLVDKS